MTDYSRIIRFLRRESILLLIMTLVGVLIMPAAIFLVGTEVFGDYAGAGFGEFYRDIHSRLRGGEGVIVFLLASPYLILQTVRLTVRIFSRMSPAADSGGKRQRVATDGDGNL